MFISKGKLKGKTFEYKVRKFLREKGWFVYSKGVSTPGPDILAIRDNYILLMELKSYKKKNYGALKKEINNLASKLEGYINKNKEPLKKFNLYGYVLVNLRGEKRVYSTSINSLNRKIEKFSTLEEWYDNFLRNLIDFYHC